MIPFVIRTTAAACLLLAVAVQSTQLYAGGLAHAQSAERPALDVPYVPTSLEVVRKMLSLAGVSSSDILYDLGCGDGRIVVTAARDMKVRKAIGVDIDPERIRESNENARQAGVTDRVTFLQKDLFEMDFSEATVLSLYLLPSVNVKLRPKILRDLKPGSRVVSHDFDMAEWEPDQVADLDGDRVYLWVVPANVNGIWSWKTGEVRNTLELGQHFQNLEKAELHMNGAFVPLSDVKLRGDKLEFVAASDIDDMQAPVKFSVSVRENTMTGTISSGEKSKPWKAERNPSTMTPLDANESMVKAGRRRP